MKEIEFMFFFMVGGLAIGTFLKAMYLFYEIWQECKSEETGQ